MPKYPYKPIYDLNVLAKLLKVTRKELDELYYSSNNFFFLHEREQKKDGSYRDTYDVKQRLKIIHHKICTKILKKTEYPRYLQGALVGRDFLSNAKNHSGKKILISEDITNFFPSISKKIVYQVWCGFFKFSKEVAEYLSEIITYNGYLVQGAKPSTYICNLVFWNRESELVNYFQQKGFTYTRYVDDITISSERILSSAEKNDIISRIYNLFKSIAVKPNRNKHKIMPRNKRQLVHNVNVNSKVPTMPKGKRDKIRAAVHECEKVFEINPNNKSYKSLYRKTMGRVVHLKRMHPLEGETLKKRLITITPIC